MRNANVLRNGLLCLLVLVLAGCAAGEPPMPRILWPPPPNKSYLEFIGVYYSQHSFEKTKSEKIKEEVIGKESAIAFDQPMGIASDGQGNVYVSDGQKGVVFVYDFNARHVSRYIEEAVFSFPAGLAIDSQGRLYVADAGAQNVKVFSADRQPLFSIGGPERFLRPVQLALNERLGRLYVSDGRGHKIVVFDLQGNYLFSFSGPGGDVGLLYAPQGLAIDDQERVFVADQLNARFMVFDADGKYLYTFGERGDREWQFEFPKGAAFDSDGNLHIIDSRKGALMTFSPEGRALLFTGGGDKFSPVSFATPTAIYIDKKDTIYVADGINRRFSVWQYLSDDYLAQHPITKEEKKQTEGIVDKSAK